LEILICASQIYLDHLLFVKNIPALNRQVSKRERNEPLRRHDLRRERDLRAKLKRKLESPFYLGSL
jgi:hypothetical protein